MKICPPLKSLLRPALVAIVCVAVSGSCTQNRDDLQQAADAIRQHAARQKPAFRNDAINFNGSLSAVEGGDGVCACITVCNKKGNDCASACSPPNCAPWP